MKLLENTSIKTESVSFDNIPEGTQFCIGSDLTMDMDYYEADGTDRIKYAIESIIEQLMKKSMFDPSKNCITVNVSIGDKEDIDDEGNVL